MILRSKRALQSAVPDSPNMVLRSKRVLQDSGAQPAKKRRKRQQRDNEGMVLRSKRVRQDSGAQSAKKRRKQQQRDNKGGRSKRVCQGSGAQPAKKRRKRDSEGVRSQRTKKQKDPAWLLELRQEIVTSLSSCDIDISPVLDLLVLQKMRSKYKEGEEKHKKLTERIISRTDMISLQDRQIQRLEMEKRLWLSRKRQLRLRNFM